MLDDPSFALFVARRAAAVAVSATRGDVPAPPVTLLAGNGVQSRLLEALHAAARERIVALDESQGLDADTDIGIGDGVARPVFVAASPGSRRARRHRRSRRRGARGGHTCRHVARSRGAGAGRARARCATGRGARHGQPCGAGAIADEWGVDDLVNVELGDRRDVRRLLRVLTDQPRALVLGAGGARAFAQIGAIRAFEEAGEEFDVVLGSGFGAVIGAQYRARVDRRRVAGPKPRGLVCARPYADPAVAVGVQWRVGRGVAASLVRSRATSPTRACSSGRASPTSPTTCRAR